MQNIRLLAVFFLLLSAGSSGYAFTFFEIPLPVDKEVSSQLSEDLVDLSSSHLTAFSDNLNPRLSFPSNAILTGEDSRLHSKVKAYFSGCRYLEPGLSLPDIIFPFHTFL